MRRSHVETMSSLEQANPLEDALSWWTRFEEDALLATVLAENPEESARGDLSSVLSGRPHRLKRVALIGLCALVAGAAALAVDLTGSGSPSAFAAWTTTTTTPPASQLAAADSSCQQRWKLGLQALGYPEAATLPATLPPLVLTDSRGPYEMLVYEGPTGEGLCLWDSSGVLSVGGGNGGQLPAASDSSIGVPGVGFDRNRSSVLTYAFGHAGALVTGVTLDLANGVRVEATVQNGFYGAWWPSQTDVTATEVATSEGGAYHQDFGDIGPNNIGPNEPSSSGVEP